MNVPSSVTGPDRTTGPDVGRRPGGRRGGGGDEFDSALTAELGRPAPDEDAERERGRRGVGTH